MSSLFKTREWWSTHLDDDQGFDTKSLVVANIDNSSDREDKVIVGGLSGILRIFSLSKGIEDYEATDLLLEVDMNIPILQIAAGFFLTASDHLHLAILHPRKLSVYSISGTGGFSEQGSSHNMLLLYEHKLQRSSFNMIVGPFGQGSGRDFFCVQSLDGTLSFFEQENYTFTRFLSNHLLPAPIDYSKTCDSFIIFSSSWILESYRYQVLAIAKNDPDKIQPGGIKAMREAQTSGRRTSPDWSAVLGESALELTVVMLENNTEVIVVLGERNLFVMEVDGSSCRYSLRFDFYPISMHSFSCNGSLIILVAAESKTINVMKDANLVWAAQASFAPIAIMKGHFSSYPGMIVALADSGHLSCSYLGSNPSVNIMPVPLPREPIDLPKGEEEMNKLKLIIGSVREELSPVYTGSKKNQSQAEVIIDVQKMELVGKICHGENNNIPGRRAVLIPIKLHAKNTVRDVRLTLDASSPFVIETNVIFFPLLDSQSVSETVIEVESSNNFFPSSLKVTLTATFNNASGAPKASRHCCYLPLELIARSSKTSRDLKHIISLDIISNKLITLSTLFLDLPMIEQSESSATTELGVEFLIPQSSRVSVTAFAKNPKQTFKIKSDDFESMAFITSEVIRRLQMQHIKFDAAAVDKENGLQLQPYFAAIERHNRVRNKISETEAQLSHCMSQLRATEKRFLIKLKDRNPAPLNDVEFLLQHTSSKASRLSEAIIHLSGQFEKNSNILSFSTRLVVQLISIATGMKPEQTKVVLSYLTPQYKPQFEEGWEERVDAALSEVVKIPGNFNQKEFQIPSDTGRLMKLIKGFVNILLRGDFVWSRTAQDTNVSRESPPPGQQMKKNYTNPATEVIPEEEEDDSK